MEILSFVLIIYGILVLYLTLSKSNLLFNNPKTKMFFKMFGEKGTIIFFVIWGLIALGIGVYLQL
jgi:hypothetical protein